ncbi:4Fe-4S binding protein [Cryptobacterium curtum]|uniref:4Fe-4S binding protein n=1 Tax=Cryptobacterium curtum TaxID=84163 RepID=UPI00248EF6EC|nr:4Fe-4S binding protein [Cryptobacterium curtum]
MSRIIVDESYCKGCGLCVDACPEGIVALADDRINEKGYHPAILTNEAACTACSSCATMCPDVAITVVRSR